MQIQNKYNIGDKVYLKTDTEQLACIVTAIIIEPGDNICYRIGCGHNACEHYEIELRATQDKELKASYL